MAEEAGAGRGAVLRVVSSSGEQERLLVIVWLDSVTELSDGRVLFPDSEKGSCKFFISFIWSYHDDLFHPSTLVPSWRTVYSHWSQNSLLNNSFHFQSFSIVSILFLCHQKTNPCNWLIKMTPDVACSQSAHFHDTALCRDVHTMKFGWWLIRKCLVMFLL